MEQWYPDRSALTRPVFHSLAEQIGMAIQEGLLTPGSRLPAQRELADDMGVSLQTVSRAYEELRRKGFVQGEIGRGTYVRTLPHLEATPFRTSRSSDAIVDLSIFKPVVDSFHEGLLKQELEKLSCDVPQDVLFSFRPNEGLPRHRSAAVEWLKLCGVSATRERVIITNGVTQATTTAILAAASPGATIVTEGIGHHSLASLCSSTGLKLKGLRLDAGGIEPQAFDHVCRLGGVRVLYLMPSLANPTVYLMPQERREEICRIARTYNVTIVENDVLGPLVPNKPAPIASMAPERTFYLTSFTKCIMPGLRTGCMTVPPGLFKTAKNRLLATAWMATPLMAEIASRWVVNGTARKILLWQRRAAHERYKSAVQILGDRPYRSHPHALHIWLPLAGRWRSDPFVSKALDHGVAIAPSGPFMIDNDLNARAVRISLGSDKKENLERGLRVVEELLEQEAEFSVSPF